MQWEPTELEAHTPRGVYLIYRVGDVWVARYRERGTELIGRGYAIEPNDGHWPSAHAAQAACAAHHGRLERGDSPLQASEWTRRHLEYLAASTLAGGAP